MTRWALRPGVIQKEPAYAGSFVSAKNNPSGLPLVGHLPLHKGGFGLSPPPLCWQAAALFAAANGAPSAGCESAAPLPAASRRAHHPPEGFLPPPALCCKHTVNVILANKILLVKCGKLV